MIVPCTTVPSNWKYCFNDWDVWLYPEIHRAWDLITEQEIPYQSESMTRDYNQEMDLTKLSNEELLDLREQTVKEVTKYNNFQMARKIQINSLYGALGNQYFRHYRLDNAEAITLTGQVSIRWIERKVNEFCNKALKTEDVDYVIASDTDSIYMNLGPLVEKLSLRVHLLPRSLTSSTTSVRIASCRSSIHLMMNCLTT